MLAAGVLWFLGRGIDRRKRIQRVWQNAFFGAAALALVWAALGLVDMLGRPTKEAIGKIGGRSSRTFNEISKGAPTKTTVETVEVQIPDGTFSTTGAYGSCRLKVFYSTGRITGRIYVHSAECMD